MFTWLQKYRPVRTCFLEKCLEFCFRIDLLYQGWASKHVAMSSMPNGRRLGPPQLQRTSALELCEVDLGVH
jgi:hypothetical protein